MAKQVTVTLRIETELAERLALYAQALAATSGLRVTRSDVMRMLLGSALERAEEDLPERLALFPAPPSL